MSLKYLALFVGTLLLSACMTYTNEIYNAQTMNISSRCLVLKKDLTLTPLNKEQTAYYANLVTNPTDSQNNVILKKGTHLEITKFIRWWDFAYATRWTVILSTYDGKYPTIYDYYWENPSYNSLNPYLPYTDPNAKPHLVWIGSRSISGDGPYQFHLNPMYLTPCSGSTAHR